jgi:hypothetical protein
MPRFLLIIIYEFQQTRHFYWLNRLILQVPVAFFLHCHYPGLGQVTFET